MKKLSNPYLKFGDEYNCFGCSPLNKFGLKLNFYEDGDTLFTKWTPNKNYMGFTGVLHGGIQATLFDEIAAWIISIQLDTSGVTSKLEIQYKKPVRIENKHITISANIQSNDVKYALVHAKLMNEKGEISSTAEVTYRIFPKEMAMKKLYFPGREAFFQ